MLTYLPKIDPDNTATLIANMNIIAARVDVETTVSGFTLRGATLLNGAKKGFLRPRDADKLPVWKDASDLQQYNEVGVTSGKISPIYLFTNNGADIVGGVQGTNPTDIIIRADWTSPSGVQHTNQYYKLRIRYDKEGNDTYDIIRNTLYKINITGVKGPGYSSLDEAKSLRPVNIEYDITVANPVSSDVVVGNGDYYLGVDASIVQIYNYKLGNGLFGNSTTNLQVATLTHNAPASVNITSCHISGSTGVTSATTIPAPNGTIQTIPIRINLANNITSGKVYIQIGALYKEVSFTVNLMDAHSLNNANLGTGFTQAEVLSSVTSWHWLTTSSLGSEVGKQAYGTLNPTDNLYITAADFLPDPSEYDISNGIERSATIRLMKQPGDFTTIYLRQPVAFYVGRFGGADFASSPGGYSQPLFIERAEEAGTLRWLNNTTTTTNVTDKVHGRQGTITLTNNFAANQPEAAFACRNRNRDIDGSGTIEDNEVVWYLPAQNQLMGAWVINLTHTTNSFNAFYYWSATETTAINSWLVNFNIGITYDDGNKTIYSRVRCVRDLTPP